MKFKMSENSLVAILLRSPWWISMTVVALMTLISFALLPPPYVAFGVMGSFPFLVVGVIAARRQWGALSPAKVAKVLAQVGAMSWRDFSAHAERTFAQLGYQVERLNSPYADFSLRKDGQTTLLSCKRWKAASHGVEALRELVAAKEAQDASRCTYVSLGPVTDTAQRFAKAQGVVLIHGAALAALFQRTGESA